MNVPRRLPPHDGTSVGTALYRLIGGRSPAALWAWAEDVYAPPAAPDARAVASSGFTVMDCVDHCVPLAALQPVDWTSLMLMRLHDTCPSAPLQAWLIEGLPTLFPDRSSVQGFATSAAGDAVLPVLPYDVCIAIARIAQQHTATPSLRRGARFAGFTNDSLAHAEGVSASYGLPKTAPIVVFTEPRTNGPDIFERETASHGSQKARLFTAAHGQ